MTDGQIIVTANQIGPSKSLRVMQPNSGKWMDFEKETERTIRKTISRLKKEGLDFITRTEKIKSEGEDGNLVEKEVIRVWRVA